MLEEWRGDGPALLDVGCGALGLAAFLRDVRVVGVDVAQTVEEAPNFTFTPGSITDLPFGDDSFPFASCVDVLEHLPTDVRARAVLELVRVASRAVVVACPHGQNAERADRRFFERLCARGKPIPPWLEEHLRQPYPTVEWLRGEVETAATTLGKKVLIDVRFCETPWSSAVIRACALRSRALYAAVNVALGSVIPLTSGADDPGSYRAIMTIRFRDA